MSAVIAGGRDGRLIDYLKSGLSVLIQFNDHGIGDMIMFQPLYQRLKVLYPDVHFYLEPNKDQQYFAEPIKIEPDLIFKVIFRETTGDLKNPRSKPQRCAEEELGLPFGPDLEFTWKPRELTDTIKIKENCIGVVFQVQSDPSKGLSAPIARLVWEHIRLRGFTPLEVCFNNPNHNAKNKRAAFLDYSCRDFSASEENMFSVIRQCRGFVGVNTGTFCAATCIKNGHTLHIFTGRYHFSPWYKKYDPVPEMDCSNPRTMEWGVLDSYLDECIINPN